MKEVYTNLFVGSQNDYECLQNKQDWRIVQACKIPYHSKALGYQSNRAAPKDHPERLVALRDNKLILNMIDGPAYINLPAEIKADIDTIFKITLEYIQKNIVNCKLFVHCNQGMSRSPTIALMYLKKYTNKFENINVENAITEFIKIYPLYNPALGMQEYIISNW